MFFLTFFDGGLVYLIFQDWIGFDMGFCVFMMVGRKDVGLCVCVLLVIVYGDV